MTDVSSAKSTSNAQKRNRLIEIISNRSLQTGEEITLASGRKSNFYFNMKPTMMNAEGAHLIAALVLDNIADLEADLIGGLEMGAVPLAASVAAVSHAQDRALNSFFVRKAAKDHGTQSLIEGLAKGETMAGKRVIIIEDVTTTGGSSIKAAATLRAAGAEILRVVTIVDREEGAFDAFAKEGLELSPILSVSDFSNDT